MNAEKLRNYCKGKKGVTESFPFNEDVLVFKVLGKVFLLTDLRDPYSMNVKCEPGNAVELREKYHQVTPAYHMNKKHWNSVIFEGMNDLLLQQMIDHSYELVVKGMTKKMQLTLSSMQTVILMIFAGIYI